MANEIYRILYVENSAEKVTELKQLIRTRSLDSKITFDVITTDSLEGIGLAVEKNSCDLIILQDSPRVPSLNEIQNALGVKDIPVCVLVNEDEFMVKRPVMIDEGAVDVGLLSQGDVLFKQIVRAIFEIKTQEGYRETLEKNAKLTELTAQLAESSEDLIAYFGSEDGLFLYANEAFLQYFGYADFSELAATTVLEYISPEQSAQFKKMMKIVSRTGKEQSHTLSLKNPKTGSSDEENVLLKQAMHKEVPCLEIFVEKEAGANAVSTVPMDSQAMSAQTIFYNRLSFIEGLSNFVGSSSWLLSLVLQDYFNFRKRYGVEILESYFLALSKHLNEQISSLHYARYSDESMILLLTNSDMTKVDRLGMAIVASAEGFVYQSGEHKIQGKFTFSYTNLGNDVVSIVDSCKRLDELSGLLDTRVVFSDNEEEVAEHTSGLSSEGATLSDGKDIEEEYMPLYHALRGHNIKQVYTPVVDFSMKGLENYVATFVLHNEEGEVVLWNKSFAYNSDNSLMIELDQFMIQHAVEELTKANDPSKRVMIPLTKYYLKKADQLVEWIKGNALKYFTSHQIVIGLVEEAIDESFDDAQQFFDRLAAENYSTMVYDVVDVTSTRVTELKVAMVALSENCIARMSRSISSDEMVKLPKLLEHLQEAGAGVLASGVNSPTSMTLVWEYNIPYAMGQMVGMPTEALDFDFSQVIM